MLIKDLNVKNSCKLGVYPQKNPKSPKIAKKYLTFFRTVLEKNPARGIVILMIVHRFVSLSENCQPVICDK